MVSVFKFKGQGHDLVNFKVIFIKRKCSNTVQFVHTYGSHNKTNIFVKRYIVFTSIYYLDICSLKREEKNTCSSHSLGGNQVVLISQNENC